MKKYVAAVDQGTTSSRVFVFDVAGRVVRAASRRHGQSLPNEGWVEHNANEIAFNVGECLNEALSGIESEVAAVGLTNQRETVVAWDRVSLEPVCPAIVWQDRRTAAFCDAIRRDGFEGVLRAKTGLLANPYFSATKMKWIVDNVPRAKILADEGRLAFGTIDAWLVAHLTKGRSFVTDVTNASRTLLFNIHTQDWDEELLSYFGIKRDWLPQVVDSSGVIGSATVGGADIPIAGLAGDQHAALFGNGCFNEGDVKNTYGTGCFILRNSGDKPSPVTDGLLSTVAWRIGGKTTYALEGSVFSAGSAIEWLIHTARLVDDLKELEHILEDSADTKGVCFVPAFSGLGAPTWDAEARAAFVGVTLGSGKNEMARAVCESIAFSAKDALKYMEAASGTELSALNVDGGVTNNNAIMRFQADILNIPVIRPANAETTAIGAAGLAGLAVGFWGSYAEIAALKGETTAFAPRMGAEERSRREAEWRAAVKRVGVL